MLDFRKGVDILAAVGGVSTIAEARQLFARRLDPEHLARLGTITNEEALLKIANAIAMCDPERVFIHTGSEADCAAVRDLSLEKGEEAKLAIPGHTIHFDLPEDQGRMVDQTFYIANPDEQVSSLAKKELRDESHAYVREHMRGIMRGMTMFVGFYSRGPVGARAAIPAIEISSSTYVLHSAELLYRNCFADFDAEVARRGEFFTNVHSQGPNRSEDVPKARIYMDRSWQTTFSTFCTYAGNTLLMKKGNHRFASDTAIYRHHGEELSEHMFITGMTGPGGRTTYFAGAAPSGCGKTTTAMVGSNFIGDDLAQMWIGDDGTLRAVNPEIGIFGIIADDLMAGLYGAPLCLAGVIAVGWPAVALLNAAGRCSRRAVVVVSGLVGLTVFILFPLGGIFIPLGCLGAGAGLAVGLPDALTPDTEPLDTGPQDA